MYLLYVSSIVCSILRVVISGSHQVSSFSSQGGKGGGRPCPRVAYSTVYIMSVVYCIPRVISSKALHIVRINTCPLSCRFKGRLVSTPRSLTSFPFMLPLPKAMFCFAPAPLRTISMDERAGSYASMYNVSIWIVPSSRC